MVKNATQLLDGYIPLQLKNRNDFKTIIRAKILMALYLSVIIIVIFMMTFQLLVIPTSNKDWMHGIAASILAMVLLGFQILVFYKSDNIATSALIFSMNFFTISFCTVVITGGWHSPVLLLFFCSPVVSFLVGGRGEGLYIATLVFFLGALLMIAYKMDIAPPQMLAEENIENIRFGIWVSSITLIVSCLTTYDFLLEHAMRNKFYE